MFTNVATLHWINLPTDLTTPHDELIFAPTIVKHPPSLYKVIMGLVNMGLHTIGVLQTKDGILLAL